MPPDQSIKTLLSQAASAIDSDSPRLDAEILLAQVLGKSRSFLFAWPEHTPTTEQIRSFYQLVQRREKGEPIAYLISEQEFWSLPLHISADVLIPRPETEKLVELALQRHPKRSGHILELGTGSGAISIALACERREWQLVATDLSGKALDIARSNAARHQRDNISFIEGSWYEPLPNDSRFDLIISNPPYIRASDPHLTRGDVRFEPNQALVSGESGLDDIRKIATDGSQFLRDGGWLLLEHGYNQAADVRTLFRAAGLRAVHSETDLAGHERVTLGQFICERAL